MKQIIPSILFKTFDISQVSTEPTRSLTRQMLDQHIQTLCPGMSYLLDQEDYITRVGTEPTFDSLYKATLWTLPTYNYATLTGKVLPASSLTRAMNDVLSSSARQFYASRPNLLVPEFHIQTQTPQASLNIPPSGLLDLYDYRELPLCYYQQLGGWNLGDKVLYFESGPSINDLKPTPPYLKLIPVWDTVTEAIKTLPENNYQNQPQQSSDKSPASGPILALINKSLTNSATRSNIYNYLKDKDLTNPKVLADLLNQGF